MKLTIFALFLLAAAVIFYPLSGFFGKNVIFSPDLITHLWYSGYFAEYMAANKSIPSVVNVWNASIGNPISLFYGKNLYIMVGILVDFLGLYSSFRLWLLILTFFLFFSIYSFLNKTIKNRVLSCFIASIFCLSIYPITNLYNRGAITEWFANSLFITGLFFWLTSINEKVPYKKIIYKTVFTIVMLLFVSIHPISSALNFFIFILVLIFSLFTIIKEMPKQNTYKKKKKNTPKQINILKIDIISNIISFIVIILFNIKYIYTIFRFSSAVDISASTSVLAFYRGIDELFTRLSFFPLDRRMFERPIWEIPTPYLDAQINVYLLIIMFIVFSISTVLFWNLLKHKDDLKIIQIINNQYYYVFATICFIITLILLFSTSITPWEVLENKRYFSFLSFAQFAYRYVNQINLFLLLSTVYYIIFIFHSKEKERIKYYISKYIKLIYSLSIITLIFSFYGIYQKINDRLSNWFVSYIVTQQIKDQWLGDFSIVNNMNYGYSDYMIRGPQISYNDPLSIENITIQFPLDVRFGNVEAIDLLLLNKTLINFKVFPFPWNYIRINDSMIKTSDMALIDDMPSIILEGGYYNIEYIFRKDFNLRNVPERRASEEDIKIAQEQLNQYIRFNIQNIDIRSDSEIVSTNGFSEHEEWGRWSNSKNATITVMLPDNLHGKSVNIELPIVAIFHQQRIIPSINGRSLPEQQLIRAETLIFNVTDIETLAGIITIDLELPDATAPSSIINSQDDRLLGIAIFNLIIEEIQ